MEAKPLLLLILLLQRQPLLPAPRQQLNQVAVEEEVEPQLRQPQQVPALLPL